MLVLISAFWLLIDCAQCDRSASINRYKVEHEVRNSHPFSLYLVTSSRGMCWFVDCWISTSSAAAEECFINHCEVNTYVSDYSFGFLFIARRCWRNQFNYLLDLLNIFHPSMSVFPILTTWRTVLLSRFWIFPFTENPPITPGTRCGSRW